MLNVNVSIGQNRQAHFQSESIANTRWAHREPVRKTAPNTV